MLALIVACVIGIGQPEAGRRPSDTPTQAEYRRALNDLRAKVPGPNAWDAVQEARVLLLDISGKLPGPNGELGKEIDWGALSDESADAAERARAEKAFELAMANGIGAIISKIAKSGGVVRPPAAGLLIDDEVPELRTVRSCYRINKFAMKQAASQGEWDEWMERARESLGMSRLYVYDNMMIGYFVGAAVQLAAMGDIRQGVDGGGLSEKHLAELDRLLASTTPIERPSACIEGARLVSKSCIEHAYKIPDVPGLASKRDALAKADELYDNGARLALLSFGERKADAFQVKAFEAALDKKRHRILSITLPAFGKLFVTVNQCDVEAAGLRLVVAVERFRSKHGKYPAAAQEVVPEFLPSVPIDPFTGKALLYQGPREKGYDRGRPYVVYSAGYDEQDNFGTPDPVDPLRAIRPDGSGTDFILNPPRLPETRGTIGK